MHRAVRSALVTPEWLQSQLGRLSVLDASWYLPAHARDAKCEFASARIPGAAFLDVDEVCDRASPLPHMMPTRTEFAAAMARLGVSSSRPVVVYDGLGLFSAARVWWMLRSFGHPAVFVLDGGMPRWRAETRPIEAAPAVVAAAVPEAWQEPQGVVSCAQVRAWQSREPGPEDPLLVDARPLGRFRGVDPEPRPGVPSGHAPFARSLFFGSLLREGALKPREELAAAFLEAGVDPARPGKIVLTCGSGVTAAVLLLALHELGRPWESMELFDGAWAEWATTPGCPVVRDPQ